MTLPKRVATIGAGQMAEAILRGLLQAGMEPGQLVASDPDAGRRAHLQRELGIEVLADNHVAASQAEIAVLAVKPYQLEAVAGLLPQDPGPLYLSILAGRSLDDLRRQLGPRVARAMPNTPALIGAGVSALAVPDTLEASERERLEAVLKAIGRVVLVAEPALDAVTGVSGSGPAYVYLMIESLTDAGVREGLPADVARTLAAETLCGAARMVLETGEHPALLRERVMSPGGTTAAGIAALERAGLRAAVHEAVHAAAARSREISSGR